MLGKIRRGIDEARLFYVVVYLVYIFSLVFISEKTNLVGGDSPPTALLPVSILRWKTLRLDPVINLLPQYFDLGDPPHYIVKSGEHYYSKYSPLPAILAIPIYAVFLPFIDTSTEGLHLFLKLSRFVSLFISIASLMVVFMILKTIYRQSTAILFTLLYGFGTFTWSSATNTLSTQSTGELFMALHLLTLWMMVSQNNSQRKFLLTPYIIAGLMAGMAIAVRSHLIVPLLFTSIYILRTRSSDFKFFLSYLASLSFPVFLIALYQTWAFGLPWETGYGIEASVGWITPFWEGLLGILVSPTHGLLVYSPILLLSIFGGVIVWLWHLKSRIYKKTVSHLFSKKDDLLAWVIMACFAHLIIMSHWWAWHGGIAFNQRMLQEIHPWLIVLFAYSWDQIRHVFTLRFIFISAGIWSIFMNVVRVTFYKRHLEYVGTYNPSFNWSLKRMELLMYLNWHGTSDFILELSKTILGLTFMVLIVTMVFLFLFKIVTLKRISKKTEFIE